MPKNGFYALIINNLHRVKPPLKSSLIFIGGFTTSFSLIFRSLYSKNSMGETPYAKNF